MKGAFLVAKDNHLFDVVSRLLCSLGGQASTDGAVVQLRDESGGLITAYRVLSGYDWEFKSGELKPAIGSDHPDLSLMNGIAIECRNEFTFATLAKAVAETCSTKVWVVDGDGVVWRAAEVDPGQIRL